MEESENKQEKNKGGAPSKFTQELADKICTLIATSHKSLRTICKELGMNVSTILTWLADPEKAGFAAQYARAKQEQADLLVDEMIEISDQIDNDTIVTEKGPKPNNEWINRSRLRVDTRKWIASKLKPKKYGDKLDLTTNNESLNKEPTKITLANGTVIDL